MRITHTNITRMLILLLIGGCDGTGSGLKGITVSGGSGGTGSNAPPVLSFFVQPNSANARQTISPAVEVLARDSLGATDSAFTGTISVALESNSTGATLSGTTTVRPVNGIASFSTLSIDKAGTYTLSASSSGAATVTSSTFSISTVTTP